MLELHDIKCMQNYDTSSLLYGTWSGYGFGGTVHSLTTDLPLSELSLIRGLIVTDRNLLALYLFVGKKLKWRQKENVWKLPLKKRLRRSRELKRQN